MGDPKLLREATNPRNWLGKVMNRSVAAWQRLALLRGGFSGGKVKRQLLSQKKFQEMQVALNRGEIDIRSGKDSAYQYNMLVDQAQRSRKGG